MTKQCYTFRVAFNARCYGDVKIEAPTYQAACAQLTHDNIGGLFMQTDDIDTSEISGVHLFGWQNDVDEEGGPLGVDLPDPEDAGKYHAVPYNPDDPSCDRWIVKAADDPSVTFTKDQAVIIAAIMNNQK